MSATATHIKPTNIAGYLTAIARERPEAPAIHFSQSASGDVLYRTWTFRELDADSTAIARGLLQRGLRPGDRAAVMVKPGPDFFSLTFGLMKAGIVPVLIDPGMGIKNLGRCLAEAMPRAFIGNAKANLARLLFGWARRSLELSITTTGGFFLANDTLEKIRQRGRDVAELPATGANDPAAILFTSGSTGVAKGVVYTHAMFEAQVDAVRRTYDIRPGEVDLPTFPLFALFAPALAMTAVIPDMDFTRPGGVAPEAIIQPVLRFAATTMFGSPALLRAVCRGRRMMPSLNRVISAGAPVPARVLHDFSRLLRPGAAIFTPYGATEALPVCSIGSGEILSETSKRTEEGAGTCVGKPVAGIAVAIIQISDGPIREWTKDLLVDAGAVGEIAVKAPWVTAEYFGRPEATQLAKIPDPDGGFWHRMGDVGWRDELGRIWFCGRKSHRVVTRDRTYFTEQVEGILNAATPWVRTALVGMKQGDDLRPVVCLEQLKADLPGPAPKRTALEWLVRERASRFTLTRPIDVYLWHPKFPVDIRHNAKIFRERLAVWAAGKLR